MRISKPIPVAYGSWAFEKLSLNEFLGILVESRWLIATLILISGLGAALHIFITPPVYESDVLLQVDQEATGIGALDDFSDLSSFYDGAQVEMEMEILKSRAVLSPVVKKLNLNVSASPSYLPLIGAAIASSGTSAEQTIKSAIDALEEWSGSWFNFYGFNLSKYAWGDEHIVIDRFNVPADYPDQKYTVVAGTDNAYRLLDSNGELFAQGVVGKPLDVWPAAAGSQSLLISELEGRPGTHFSLAAKPQLEAVYGLERSITVSALGYSEDAGNVPSGLIRISLEGTDRDKTTAIVNQIAAVYLKINEKRQSGQAESTLKSLEEQLPKIKAETEQAEAALIDYRAQHGSVDLPLETESISNKIVVAETELIKLRAQRDKLLGRFTPKFTARADHVAVLSNRIAGLEAQKRALQEQMAGLPRTQQGILRLKRDVDVNRQLYSLLSNKLHELDVVSAGTPGNMRIIDYAAVPIKPVGAGHSLIISIYLFWGMLLGIGLAFVRKFLFDVVEDPDVIEQRLGLPVYAVVPHSDQQEKIARKHNKGYGKRRGHSVLSATGVEDVAVESLRSLRTWLYFALLGTKNNILLITGPGPGIGKSFLSMNLAAVLASAGKRTLIIDADLRKGHLHDYFGMSRENGLSNAISGETDIEQAIRETEIEQLFILPTGALPSNPSELLLNERFESMLAKISAKFDHVIIDSPPVLPVTDAAILGRIAGAALLVVKANTHRMREIEQTVKRLRQVDVELKGVVFNDMMTSKYYGYGKYYGHAYSYAGGK